MARPTTRLHPVSDFNLVLLQRRSVKVYIKLVTRLNRSVYNTIHRCWSSRKKHNAKPVNTCPWNTIAVKKMRRNRNVQIELSQRLSTSESTEFDLSSPFFSADASRVTAPSANARWSVGWPAAILPLLPCLMLAQTIGSAIRPAAIPIPIRVCGLWCTDTFLAMCRQLTLLVLYWHIYLERRIRVGARSRFRCSE
jgi:hypothetical protein